MPTQILQGEKTAFIALVTIQSAYEAARLVDVMVNYEDIPTVIGRQLQVYEANFPYLIELMDVFAASDADLIAAGIYYKKTALASVTNPTAIINCTYSTNGLTVQYTDNILGLMVVGKSVVDTITVDATKTLSFLYVGPGSSVNMADSTAAGSSINRIELAFIRSTAARLNLVKFGSNIGPVVVQPGAFYGGISNDNPNLTCAAPVTDLKAGIITHNSIQLIWVPPVSGYLFIDVFFRKTGSSVWVKVTDLHGDYAADNTGYMFRQLERDTFYDFEVITTCNNGGTAKLALNQAQTNNA